MRTEDVKPDGTRFFNCNLFARMGQLQGTRIMTGTNGWTDVARRWPVPEGVREATIGCFLSMPGRAWFDDVKLEAVEPPDWQTARTDHYDFRWLPGDSIPEEAQRFNEESYRTAAEFLGVKDGPRAVFTKYPDNATKQEYTGDGGDGHRRGVEIHKIWARDRHEIAHVLADAWGEPTPLLGEGLAVYLAGWDNLPAGKAARKVLDEGKWISLDELAKSFRAHPDAVSYPIAGAYVEWIEATRGREALKELYRSKTPDLKDADAGLRAYLLK
jgi:hypothetical protein